jgi:hypothetical protein
MAAELANQPVFVKSEGYVLPGVFVMGAAVGTDKTGDALANAKKVLESLQSTPATVAELDRAKTEVVNELTAAISKDDSRSVARRRDVSTQCSAGSSRIVAICNTG